MTQGPAARRLLAVVLLNEAASSQGLPGKVVEESFMLGKQRAMGDGIVLGRLFMCTASFLG